MGAGFHAVRAVGVAKRADATCADDGATPSADWRSRDAPARVNSDAQAPAAPGFNSDLRDWGCDRADCFEAGVNLDGVNISKTG